LPIPAVSPAVSLASVDCFRSEPCRHGRRFFQVQV